MAQNEVIALFLAPALAAVVLWASNELYYRAFGPHKRMASLISGLVGTPVHELAHAVVALLAGFKLKKVAFYSPDPHSMTLGYVNFLYSPNRLTHQIGIVFVGIAPLVVGAYGVYALFRLNNLPLMHHYLSIEAIQYGNAGANWERFIGWGRDMAESVHAWPDYLAVLLSVMIGLHATPSKADLKGTTLGSFVLMIALSAAYLGLMIGGEAFHPFPSYFIASVHHLSMSILQLAGLSILSGVLLAGIIFSWKLLFANFQTRNGPAQST